jgi:hypothetical protein
MFLHLGLPVAVERSRARRGFIGQMSPLGCNEIQDEHTQFYSPPWYKSRTVSNLFRLSHPVPLRPARVALHCA